jgi:Na+-translocating ferredoxin:NAD+ oxidoreductase RnfD subunit
VRIRRFLRTPKGITLLAIGVPAAMATISSTLTHGPFALKTLLAAMVTAGALDVVILRVRRKRWIFPDGALITGMIVGMILTPVTPLWTTVATSAIAIASKYILRTHTANVFNPAALALLISFLAFDTGQDWWGALAEANPRSASLVLIVAGGFVLSKLHKLPVALSFLGAYYLLSTAASFLGDTSNLAELYRAPDIQAALFFAFFMVSDPPTCPPGTRDQLVYGCIVGVVAFAAFQWIGAVYWLIAGLMAGNLWEAARRIRERQKRARVTSAAGATG